MKTLLVLMLAAASGFALEKSADDYFRGASAKYIGGQLQDAAVEAGEGLREYPNDARLRNMNGLLNQMKNQQRQDQNQSGGSPNKPDDKDKKNQNGKNDSDKDQQNKDQNPKDQNGKQNPQNKGEPPKDSAGQGKDQKPPQPSPQAQQNGNGADSAGKAHDTTGQGGQMARLPGQMSKEDAERLLKSFIDEEKQAQQSRLGKPHKSASGGQDW